MFESRLVDVVIEKDEVMLGPGCGHGWKVCIWGEGVLLVGTDHP